MKKIGLTESIKKLLENNYNTFEEFLNDIRNTTFNFYMNLINELEDFENKNLEKYTELSRQDYHYWQQYNDLKNEICGDYEVSDFIYTKRQYGEEKALKHLNYVIDEHIKKLSKSITKEIGDVISIQETGDNTYHLEGNNGICNIIVSPIKLSSNKSSITKTRIKIIDVTKRDKPLDYVEPEEDNEYIKEWKQKELDAYKETNEQFWTDLKFYRDEEDKIYEEYNNIRFENSSEAKELYKKYVEADKKVRDFIHSHYFFYDKGHSKNFEELCKKQINKHFEVLQNKVVEKIGKIQKIVPTATNGYNYYFEGTTGKCNVEVIFAGGYNIQRLHTRWIIRNIQKY